MREGELLKAVEGNATGRISISQEDWVFEGKKEKELGLDYPFVLQRREVKQVTSEEVNGVQSWAAQGGGAGKRQTPSFLRMSKGLFLTATPC